MTHQDIKNIITEEFSSPEAISTYKRAALTGLWNSEEKLIQKYFKKNTSVLDIGCGTGRTTIALHNLGYKVKGIDMTPSMIKIAKAHNKKINYKVMDATDLEYKDNSFDNAIFSFNGMTQIPGEENRLKAIKEINRVLKPNGIFIFTTHIRFQLKNPLIMYKEAFTIIMNYIRYPGLEFGDIFFQRDSTTRYHQKQFIHIPSKKENLLLIEKSGFELVFNDYRNNISKKDDKLKSNNCMFFILRKSSESRV